MAAADPIVCFRRVSKTFSGAMPALQDFDLSVARGEFLTLLGPSGSGKTTALMLLAGFERPDAGEILLDGHDLAGIAAHRRGIGVVFQSYALFPHMSAAENIAFPLAARGIKRAERAAKVARALDLVRLTQGRDRRPSALSGGEQQRVALARALVFAPRLVILDEPLSALDRGLRAEMQSELRRLHRELGVTMLHVTHDQAEALALSDRIAVLHRGRLRQVGTPRALYETPADAFVASCLGECNHLAGTLGERLDGETALVRLDGGAMIEAQAAETMAPGARCMVAVRPERIAIAATSAAAFGEGALSVTVREVIYAGDQIRLRLGLAGSPSDILVKRPAGAPLAGFAPGAEVAIAWQAEYARALPAEP